MIKDARGGRAASLGRETFLPFQYLLIFGGSRCRARGASALLRVAS